MAKHNSADVAFARNYLALQLQAEAAARLVATHAGHQELTTMADRIQHRSQDADDIRAWLHDWHEGMEGPSTLPFDDLIRMQDLNDMRSHHGAGFDDDWMDHLDGNHAAGIAACQDELRHGVNPQARHLAEHRLGTLRSEKAWLDRHHDAWQHDRHSEMHHDD
ncbi:MAG TPA: DUF305 domain-containing protein [Mycobacteriales bacterium]|nr:DUF305 domain-containing protein [Mycobacteriales bacterium]